MIVPLGIVSFVLTHVHLPIDRREPTAARACFDPLGTLLLALTLGAYALAMTLGRGSFGPQNIALLLAAVVGAALFGFVEQRAAAPLIRLALLGDAPLRAGLATSALVSTVMMATMVVGPFYLSRALGLNTALVGLLLSIGPLMVALTAVPAGRIADRVGAPRMTIAGLIGRGIHVRVGDNGRRDGESGGGRDRHARYVRGGGSAGHRGHGHHGGFASPSMA